MGKKFMLKVLMFVNWPIHRVGEFDCNVRNPDQVVSGERYWFSKYWPSNVEIDVVGIQNGFLLHPLEELSRIYLQHAKAFNRVNDYDLLLTFDSPSAFLFALLISKIGVHRSVPHIMIDVGLPKVSEGFKNIPANLMCGMLKQTFNSKSVSHIIFFSSCQRSFYRDALRFPESALSYVPFGVESDYFKPESVENGDYIFSAGEFRDFNTLLRVYERWEKRLPQLKIRSDLPKPKHLPPKVSWLPRAPISTFRTEALKAKFVIVPLHYTLRSTGLMTCLQSMALGKAVLTSRVPSIDGYVTDGKTALCYEPYDPEDLFRKISLLSKGNKLVEDIGREARKAVETKFNLENMAKQLWVCVSQVLRNAVE
jgi:glycosyltransferase involved in cell wall biosynthesis